jgi:carboxyl-terminal processing protease
LLRSRRGRRQSAALALVFGAVVAAGTATGAWSEAQSADAGRSPALADVSDSDAAAASADLSGLSPRQAQQWVAGSGDRWAAYYDPRQYAGLKQQLEGEYVGVGLWVQRAPGAGGMEVARVQSGAPAARAGIRVGDRLRSIDGRAVSGLPVTEVVSRLRGGGTADPDGSAVELGVSPAPVRRGAGAAPVREVTLRRQLLDADDVTVDHPAAGITRITVSAFSQEVGDEVTAAVHQVSAEAAADARAKRAAAPGILLDLRGNSGGLLAEAVESASAFLDGGSVGTYRTAAGSTPLLAGPGGDTRSPLAVLVDGGTMSAAELLTGALQDRGRAVVVGTPTFGKATVQEPAELPDGSVVERTVGRYTTPDGRSPDGTGITPDVRVPAGAGAAVAEHTAVSVLDGLRDALPLARGDHSPPNSGAPRGREVRE